MQYAEVFWHLKRIAERRITKRIYSTEVVGVRGRSRSIKRRTEGVRGLVEQRGLRFQESERRVRDSND